MPNQVKISQIEMAVSLVEHLHEWWHVVVLGIGVGVVCWCCAVVAAGAGAGLLLSHGGEPCPLYLPPAPGLV